MADVPTLGPVSWSSLRGSLNKFGTGVSLGDINAHNLNMPQRTGAIVSSQAQGTSRKAPARYSSDVQPSILGLYSMKLANPDYTGPIINVQRSSDLATSDFYSDANGSLVSPTGNTFASWVGSSTANLLTWYDQSNNDTAILKYPPPIGLGAAGTSNPASTTLSGQPYGNGAYTYSGSNQYSTGEGVFALFNKQPLKTNSKRLFLEQVLKCDAKS